MGKRRRRVRQRIGKPAPHPFAGSRIRLAEEPLFGPGRVRSRQRVGRLGTGVARRPWRTGDGHEVRSWASRDSRTDAVGRPELGVRPPGRDPSLGRRRAASGQSAGCRTVSRRTVSRRVAARGGVRGLIRGRRTPSRSGMSATGVPAPTCDGHRGPSSRPPAPSRCQVRSSRTRTRGGATPEPDARRTDSQSASKVGTADHRRASGSMSAVRPTHEAPELDRRVIGLSPRSGCRPGSRLVGRATGLVGCAGR